MEVDMNTRPDLGMLLTVEEVAARLGLRVSTIRRMILERRIDTVRPSVRAVRIPESAIRRILEKGFTPSIPPPGKA
jgi:excisionase family DNA binding protein